MLDSSSSPDNAGSSESAAAPIRVVVVANKSWEADPLVNVLLSERSRPPALGDFVAVNHPLLRPAGFAEPDPPTKPRITFTCNGTASVEVWCVQDLMNPKVHASLSLEKSRVIPKIFACAHRPSLVIAFGTAGFPESATVNGGVVIGSRTMLHDPRTSEQHRYRPTLVDEVGETRLSTGFFRQIDADVRFPAEGRFLRTPLAPAETPIILAGHNWISLGSVNVTNYDDFVWTDVETIDAFRRLDPKKVSGRIGSMETTHGIIRELSEPAPFLFVSGITDGVPFFDLQVTPRVYAQNFVAAHNAGVALAWLLPSVVAQLSAALIPG
jgi:hypothetical protein